MDILKIVGIGAVAVIAGYAIYKWKKSKEEKPAVIPPVVTPSISAPVLTPKPTPKTIPSLLKLSPAIAGTLTKAPLAPGLSANGWNGDMNNFA